MARPIRREEFVDFFKNSSLGVKEMQQHARDVGRGGDVAKAIAKADLDGDGKISGEAEARALFKQLDNFDHDGSYASITLQGRGLDELMSKAETALQPKPKTGPRPNLGLSGGQRPVGPQPTGSLASGDTLTASTSRGSSLAKDAQQLGRRYMGAGAVDVVQRDGKVAAAQYTGGMNVDTDGGKSSLAKSDRYYQSQTSMKWNGNHSLNADNIPYVVLPPSLAKATGAKLGDLVEVKKGGKSVFAIYGDVGPSLKLGEGSLALAKAFDKHAGPNNGIDGGVTYTVLPGSGKRAGIENGGAPKTSDEIQAAGKAAFEQARADGVVR